MATSLIIILQGDIEALAGVYTMAFLCVMSLFAIGTMLLKFKRPDLPRPVECPWWMAMVGLICVFIAFIGKLVGRLVGRMIERGESFRMSYCR